MRPVPPAVHNTIVRLAAAVLPSMIVQSDQGQEPQSQSDWELPSELPLSTPPAPPVRPAEPRTTVSSDTHIPAQAYPENQAQAYVSTFMQMSGSKDVQLIILNSKLTESSHNNVILLVATPSGTYQDHHSHSWPTNDGAFTFFDGPNKVKAAVTVVDGFFWTQQPQTPTTGTTTTIVVWGVTTCQSLRTPPCWEPLAHLGWKLIPLFKPGPQLLVQLTTLRQAAQYCLRGITGLSTTPPVGNHLTHFTLNIIIIDCTCDHRLGSFSCYDVAL